MKDDEVSLVEEMKAEIKAAHEALPFSEADQPSDSLSVRILRYIENVSELCFELERETKGWKGRAKRAETQLQLISNAIPPERRTGKPVHKVIEAVFDNLNEEPVDTFVEPLHVTGNESAAEAWYIRGRRSLARELIDLIRDMEPGKVEHFFLIGFCTSIEDAPNPYGDLA